MLPKRMSDHCLINLGNEKFFFHNSFIRNSTYIYNRKSSVWTYVAGSPSCQSEGWTHAPVTQCALFQNSYVIIPAKNYHDLPCTDKFNINTLQWEVNQWTDKRVTIAGGTALSIANNTRVLYLGGFVGNTTVRSNRIYEFDMSYGWKLWTSKLPVQTANTILMLSDESYCQTTGFNQEVDTSKIELI